MIEDCKRDKCFLVTYSVMHGYDMSHYNYYFYNKCVIIGMQIHGMREMTYSIRPHKLNPCILISIKHFQLISAGSDSTQSIETKIDFYNKNSEYFNEYCENKTTITKSPFTSNLKKDKPLSKSKNNITIKNKTKDKPLSKSKKEEIIIHNPQPKKKRPPPVRGRRKTVNSVYQ